MRLLLVLVAPWSGGQELAEALWRDTPGIAIGPWQCPGRYAPPPTPLPRGKDAASFRLEATAETLTSLDSRFDASGDVRIRLGDRLLKAESATYDEVTSIAHVAGDVRFDEPGFSVDGTAATVDFADSHASVDDAEFVLVDIEMRGRASHLDRREHVVELDAATVTSCPPGDAHWRIRARSIRLDTDAELATTRHARLLVGRVPVFYAPYLRFPVSGSRTSGFLVPDIYRGRDGIDLSIPYYLNLAPNYDATLTPRWIARRGIGVEGQVRHRSRRSETQADAAFLREDRDYDGEFARVDSQSAPGGFSPSDRWTLEVGHRGRRGGLRTEVDYTAVSDNDYFGDFALEEGVASRVALERRGEFEYVRGGLVARLLAQGFQRLEHGPESYRRLPELGLSYSGALTGPLGWSMGAAWTSFDSPDPAATTGERYHVDPRLRLLLDRPWGFVKLAGGVRSTGYDLANVPIGVDSRPQRDIAIAVLDAGLFLERDVMLAEGEGTQTLEPRFYYLRQSHADQADLPIFDATELTFSYRQLFRDNRYAGFDRIVDANRVSVGVVSRLLDNGGSEVMTARVGAMVHLEDPRVELGSHGPDPDLVGELAGRLGRVHIVSRLAWDAAGDELGELGTGLSYRRDVRRIVNIAYRRRFPDVDQTDLSFHWPLPGMGDRLSAFGRWNHDWRHGQIIESFAGFAYTNCCLAVKLLWHRTLDVPRNLQTTARGEDEGLMLQISFKGLGGFGSKVDSRLVRGIKGYRPGG